MVLNFEKSAKKEAIKTVSELRKAGIPTEIYLGNDDTLKVQLSYAVSQDINAVVIIGEDELKNGTVSVKNLISQQQEEISRSELVEKLKEILK